MLSPEELLEIKQAIKEAITEALPKEWLNKQEFSAEFGIGSTTIWALINDPEYPLPYSTMGGKKQFFKRSDINAYLEKRKRHNHEGKFNSLRKK